MKWQNLPRGYFYYVFKIISLQEINFEPCFHFFFFRLYFSTQISNLVLKCLFENVKAATAAKVIPSGCLSFD